MPKTAILAGATGLVGGHVLERLVSDPSFGRVIVITRRRLDGQPDKVTQIVTDFADLESHADALRGDVVFCCLGTTQRKSGRDGFYRVDHDYPVQIGERALANGASSFLLVSAIGARLGSPSFYMRTKAETERDVAGLGFATVHILRPSLLLGKRPDTRLAEDIGQAVLPMLAPLMVRRLRKYRAIEADQVAKAMVALAKDESPGTHVHPSDALAAL